MNMICKKIADWCRDNQGMEEGQYNIVVYGLNLVFNSSTKIMGVLLISILLNCVWESLVVLAVFCSMRLWAGGHHCRTSMGCFLAMLFTCLFPCGVMHFWGECSALDSFVQMLVMAGMLVYSLYEVIRYAPMNSKVNPITDNGILRRKRVMGIVECAVIAAAVICCRHNNICWLLGMPLFIEAVTISPLWNRGGG